MSDVVRDAQHEFWRPPVVPSQAAKTDMVEACDSCGAEFMVGALFCHACGASREQTAPAPHWTLYLEFHNIKRTLGLSTPALIAFVAGLACLGMAGIAVGMIYSVQTFNDFQAVQLYRMQWLLGSIAAFVAGLLLKKKPEAKPFTKRG
jgi:cytosine/uracil/thiamine/allantoin permease